MTAGAWSRATWISFGVITGIYLWAGVRAVGVVSRATVGFSVETIGHGDAEPSFSEGFVDHDTGRMVHVASLSELSDGRLVAVWYSGSHEGSGDVALYLATRGREKGAAWSQPHEVASPASVARELHRPVGKVGNAVVFIDGEGRLAMVFVTMPFGGWALSSLNVKLSADGGTSWLPAQRLTSSPLFNLGTLVKNKPLRLADGSLLLPISHEFLGRFPGFLQLSSRDQTMEVVAMRRLCGGRRFLQPAAVALDAQTALALLRSARAGETIGVARSTDGGASWSEPAPSHLPNPDAGLDAVALSQGRVLLAFNDQRSGRSRLDLALSTDAGANWSTVTTLEDEPGAEFSYPFLLRGHDGSTHLVYTWKRSRLKDLTFNEAWIEGKLGRVP
ncbi:MAG: exo-alpha-sialidase [Acidobacteriia bacterium]|nr:exo-alpha-sialidase [Terriglobia bacterium]